VATAQPMGSDTTVGPNYPSNNYNNCSYASNQQNVANDVQYIPNSDYYGNAMNTGYQAVTASGGNINIDPYSLMNAGVNAADSAGLKIRGDISGDCHLIIEGETHGKIHLANGRVTVEPSGRVTADIAAPEIVIEGNVQGNLQARDNVRMGSASHVQGSVLSPRIRIEDGARFRGKVEMTRPGHAAGSSARATPAEDHEVSRTAIVGTPRG